MKDDDGTMTRRELIAALLAGTATSLALPAALVGARRPRIAACRWEVAVDDCDGVCLSRVFSCDRHSWWEYYALGRRSPFTRPSLHLVTDTGRRLGIPPFRDDFPFPEHFQERPAVSLFTGLEPYVRHYGTHWFSTTMRWAVAFYLPRVVLT